jgi:hypothetical protein
VTQIRMLALLQFRQVYAGTVSWKTKTRRRAASKAARLSRRRNR